LRPDPVAFTQNLALDPILPFCNDVGMMNVSEKQFSLTRAASKPAARQKTKFYPLNWRMKREALAMH